MAYPRHMRDDEKKIVDKIIRKALDADLHISVEDGLDWALKFSQDYEAITAEVNATDVTMLRFRKLVHEDNEIKRPIVGDVILIHGNGEDVVHDHSDNRETADLVAT
ncbi:hypothetical protein IB276_33300 [Ensifer sp. ENS04]|uniref:hypothetical protein n=1 Tax=Ensifer sp. ENS04 TaxID=2769281 RepID=UPI00177ECE15|nr:hypothetical protein [Ensifer sp. ENS04]MBD9544325.1 hypothetical protein [Ensifer sp. ENS04]